MMNSKSLSSGALKKRFVKPQRTLLDTASAISAFPRVSRRDRPRILREHARLSIESDYFGQYSRAFSTGIFSLAATCEEVIESVSARSSRQALAHVQFPFHLNKIAMGPRMPEGGAFIRELVHVSVVRRQPLNRNRRPDASRTARVRIEQLAIDRSDQQLRDPRESGGRPLTPRRRRCKRARPSNCVAELL